METSVNFTLDANEARILNRLLLSLDKFYLDGDGWTREDVELRRKLLEATGSRKNVSE